MSRSHTRQKHNAKRRAVKRRQKNGWQDKPVQQKDENLRGTLFAAARRERRDG